MTQSFTRPVTAKWVQPLSRAGAVVETKGNETVVSFSEESLARFYLRDILMHEIGHHNDARPKSRPRARREGFANWFASEYRFRLTG